MQLSIFQSGLVAQLMRFAVVGGLAALAHYVIVLLLSATFGLRYILLFNFIAFILAFGVSYIGHKYFSFNAKTVSHKQSLPRFFGVALLGFILNETLLWAMLHFTSISPVVGMPFIIAITAIFTFVLTRQFAFNESQHVR